MTYRINVTSPRQPVIYFCGIAFCTKGIILYTTFVESLSARKGSFYTKLLWNRFLYERDHFIHNFCGIAFCAKGIILYTTFVESLIAPKVIILYHFMKRNSSFMFSESRIIIKVTTLYVHIKIFYICISKTI